MSVTSLTYRKGRGKRIADAFVYWDGSAAAYCVFCRLVVYLNKSNKIAEYLASSFFTIGMSLLGKEGRCCCGRE